MASTIKDIEETIHDASMSIRSILNKVHLYKKSELVRKAVRTFKMDAEALLDQFPDIEKDEDD